MKQGSHIFGFTLVELIVVITIIALVSGSGVIYFNSFVEGRLLQSHLFEIEETLGKLDKQVDQFDIFDYTLRLSTASGANQSFIIYKNIFDIPKSAQINFNDISGSGTISISNSDGTNLWTFKGYKGHKIIENKNLADNALLEQTWNNNIKYSAISSLGGEAINDIEVHYFTEENIGNTDDTGIQLSYIYTNPEDIDGSSTGTVSIVNISGKKSFSTTGEHLYLVFTQRGQEATIHLTTK